MKQRLRTTDHRLAHIQGVFPSFRAKETGKEHRSSSWSKSSNKTGTVKKKIFPDDLETQTM